MAAKREPVFVPVSPKGEPKSVRDAYDALPKDVRTGKSKNK
jgi:hypothetical protein